MKVSYNELQGLCRKAFLGMGFADGDASDAADMVAWMQLHELDGLEALNRGLDHVLAEQQEPARAPATIYADDDLAVLDGQSYSVLSSSSLALELGFAKARARGLAVIKIRRCHNRQLIMGYLARIAGRGMNVTAFWRNGQRPLIEQVVGFRANGQVPEIRVYAINQVPVENAHNDGVTLILANHVELLPDMRSAYDYELLACHRESALLASRERAMLDGITIDDAVWNKLKHLAARILVESTEASRSGAGPEVNDND
ncbi:Ldh family oxidoreductase [Vreelandella jeotgali]|uniref:Ldh family oxidoreductase n=1 Tax=Vreelandella jeotgali TaxID=553386 RepID=UPI00034C4AC2|nr:Ldh family oxidoreductase [Halomonas jeotgali]